MKFKNKKIAIGILCCLLVFMCVGLAALRTTLNIGGTSTAINTWAILIESITEVEGNPTNGNSVSAEVGQDKVSAQFKADFKAPGDYVEYNVKVVNNGSIDATLKSIILTSTGTDAELFSFENTAVQGSKLEAGASTEFTVKITFKSEATKLPDEDVIVDLILNYVQGEGTEVGGNTPGGGTEPEKNWDFEVDESGIITAYNYDLGTDVVVPSINYEGKKITTITQQSFTPKGNVEMYYNESPTGMYVLIHETEPNFTNILNKLVAMFTMECDGDASCEEQYKSMMYACKDSNTCYNALNIEQNAKDSNIELTITSMPETVQSQGGVYIIPDPDVPLEESMVELKPTVSSLDLSNATNLTTIENNALSDVGLESVDFGENSNITTIGDSAFSNNELTSVEIPASVETIGNNAFNSNQIETLTFETEGAVENQLTKNNKYSLTKLGTTASKLATTLKGVRSIGYNAFSNNKIKNLIIPSTLESIGSSAFENNQISELTIPKTVTNLESSVFSSNSIEELTIGKCTTDSCRYNSFGTSLKTLVVESGEIGDNAFNNSPNLTSLTLKEGVTTIGQSAFSNSAITSVTFPTTLTSIGWYSFQNNKISELVIPATLTDVGYYAFTGNSFERLTIGKCNTSICYGSSSSGNSYFGNDIKELVIQSGEIGGYAFYSNEDSSTKIQSLTLGEGVTSIGNEAFKNNEISGELIIPNTLTNIGRYVFYNNKITKMTLPKTVTTVDDYAFTGNSFERLTIEKCNTSICYGSSSSGNSYFGNDIKELVIQSGEIGGYAFYSSEDSSTKIQSLTLGEGVTSIGNNAFAYNSITEVILPITLTSIGSNAFVNNSIDTLYFPKTITSLGEGAFLENPITNLTIEECNTSICIGGQDESLDESEFHLSLTGNSYFGNQIQKLEVQSGAIGVNAFASKLISGTKIQELTLGEGVTSIGENAFAFNGITNLNLPNSLVEIGNYAFGSNTINKLFIPKNVKSIGSSAFSQNQIAELTFDENSVLTSVGTRAFQQNQISNDLILPESLTTIQTYVFYDNQISTIELSEKTTSIDAYAFSTNLIAGKISFPDTVTTLGGFDHNNITEVVFPPNLKSIKGLAFSGNDLSGTLAIPEGVTEVWIYAFSYNALTEVTLPSTITWIGIDAFASQNYLSGGSLRKININMTQSEFDANVTLQGTNWYDTTLNPTITYNPS